MMIVQAIAEFAQSYIAQARSSGRPRPSFSSHACSPCRSGGESRLISVELGIRLSSVT